MMDEAIMQERTMDERRIKKLIDTMDAMKSLVVFYQQIDQHRDGKQSKLVNDVTTVLE